jgi:predicted O-linked N-acetylglucosamine transferase (SPINDLY family)
MTSPLPGTDPLADAVAHIQSGDVARAEQLLAPALSDPALSATAARLMGHAAIRRGDPAAGRDWLRKAVAQSSGDAAFWNDLGAAERLSGDGKAASAAFERAVSLAPDMANAWHNLGLTHRVLGRTREARAALSRALELGHETAVTLTALGIVESDLGELPAARARFARAAELTPESAEAWINLGFCCNRMADWQAAEVALRKAIALDPNAALAHHHLGECHAGQGAWRESNAEYEAALACDPDANRTLVALALGKIGDPRETGPTLLAFARRIARSIPRPAPAAIFAPYPRPERLRVGFLSSDFRRHSCAFFLRPLLKALDRGRFAPVAFAQFLRNSRDAVSDEFAAMVDEFVDVSDMPDGRLAEAIRARKIDVLVDTGGYTSGSRSSVLVLKPAPAVVAWLGYPASLGMDEADARIGDAIVDPPGVADAHFSERLIRLPGPFLCYEPPASTPPAAVPPCALRGFVTFGVFNNPTKINDAAAAVWARILAAVPRSRLLVKIPVGRMKLAARGVLDVLAAAGIARERVEIVDHLPDGDAHFGSFSRIDVALDPFPYNGTTTTFETLWMGVPVVTLAGARHSARVGATILAHAGCPELVVADADAYVEIATALAEDPKRLAGYRAGLRARLQASPLMDAGRFARNFEAALDEAFAAAQARLRKS